MTFWHSPENDHCLGQKISGIQSDHPESNNFKQSMIITDMYYLLHLYFFVLQHFLESVAKKENCLVPSFSPFDMLTLYSILILTHQQQKAFEHIVGKEEIACNEQFLLFPKMFSTQSDNCTSFVHIFDFILLFAAELEEPNNYTSFVFISDIILLLAAEFEEPKIGI